MTKFVARNTMLDLKIHHKMYHECVFSSIKFYKFRLILLNFWKKITKCLISQNWNFFFPINPGLHVCKK